MSTKAKIQFPALGKNFSISCEWEGYPEGVGQVLLDHYSDPEKVKELISLGAISILGSKVNPDDEEHSFADPEDDTTVAYHRERGDDLEFADGWLYYPFLYSFSEDKGWEVAENKGQLEVLDLDYIDGYC